MIRRFLLACGIVAPLLYVGTDILGAMRYEGYGYAAQTISELSAIGAPTRALVVPLFLVWAALLIAFGYGVWQSAGRKRALRVTGALLIGFGIVCLASPFTPMHQRAVLAAGGRSLTDTLHVTGAIVDVLFILLIIGFGATAFGKRFRRYSMATVLIVLVFGALAGMDAPRLEANLPTPWVGVTERLSVYAYQLWALVLAAILLRAEGTGHGRIASDRS